MKNKKAVIFDMDGVIFDTERIYLEDWTKVFKKYGYSLNKEVYTSVMGTGRKNVKETFKNVFGDDLPIEEMYIEKDAMLFEAIEGNKVPLKKGAVEIIDFLEKNGYKIALATSAKRDRLEKQLKGANIQDKFGAIVCGDDVANSKPNPDIFLKAAAELSVKPEECIVIEDSSAGIKAAFNAGMIALHVEDLKKADYDILKYCYKSFRNLNEIMKYIENYFKYQILF